MRKELLAEVPGDPAAIAGDGIVSSCGIGEAFRRHQPQPAGKAGRAFPGHNRALVSGSTPAAGCRTQQCPPPAPSLVDTFDRTPIGEVGSEGREAVIFAVDEDDSGGA